MFERSLNELVLLSIKKINIRWNRSL